MIILDSKFNVGDIVYLRTDTEQKERIVTGVQLNPNGLIYRLVCEVTETWHYDFEISPEKIFSKSLDKNSE